MHIDVYTHSYNDRYILEYFFRHYATFADRIFFYDAFSTDGSRELAREYPMVEIRDFMCDSADDFYYQRHNNTVYQQSVGTADWVILADTDELVYYNGDIRERIQQSGDAGYNVLFPCWADLVFDEPPNTPKQIYDVCEFGGIQPPGTGKAMIFRPGVPINFEIGRHRCNPLVPTKHDAMLDTYTLHCVFLGEDYFVDKAKKRAERVPDYCRKSGFGIHVTAPESVLRESYRGFRRDAYPIGHLFK